MKGARTAQRQYIVTAGIHPVAAYPAEAQLDFPTIETSFTSGFVPRLRVRTLIS